MIIKNVRQIGNPIIRTKAKSVSNIKSKKTAKVAADLIDSMRNHNLVGMAANQIGVNLSIFVSEIRKTKFRKNRKQFDNLRIFINPKIRQSSKEKSLGWEGCGSVANSGLFSMVPRAEKVLVEAYDLKGKKFNLKAEGLLARIIQHEIDHLDGKIFLDRIKDTSTLMSSNEYIKLKK